MHTHRYGITADLMRFVTAIEQRCYAVDVTPLRFDLLRLLPCVWKRDETRREGWAEPDPLGFAGGWVRKTWSPDPTGSGMMRWKPPSTHSLLISPFGFGLPLIPFLRLYKDTKCIVKIITNGCEMRFVLRWVSWFYWVCNFWKRGGGGIAKCVSCIMLIRILEHGLKKIFLWSVDYVSTVG